jgi:uncharacterized protein YqgC (DUF456 family)
VYFVWASLLVIANLVAWLSNALSLPGNWLIVGFTACFAWLVPDGQHHGIAWTTVALLAVIAAIGEVVEMFAGAAVAGKRGGSRRGMVMAIAGTLVGSVLGAVIALPIPIVGSVMGAVVGGASGAFAGAWLGEIWKGKSLEEGYHIATGALLGRLLGTAGKLIVGAMMVVIATIDLVVD